MSNPKDSRTKLHKALVNGGYYAKSLDEFEATFSDPEKMAKLYSSLNSGGLYTKSADDFKAQYFSDLLEKKNPAESEISSGKSQDSSNGSPIFDDTTQAGPEFIPLPDAQGGAQGATDNGDTGILSNIGDRLLSYLGSFEKGVVQDVVSSPLKAAGQIQGMLTRSLGGEDFKDEDSWLYQAGKALEDASEKLLYEDPELKAGTVSQVSRGLGQAVGMIMSSPSMAAKAPQLLATSKSVLQEGAKQFFSRPAAIGALQMVDQEFSELSREVDLATKLTRDEYVQLKGKEEAGATYDLLTSTDEDKIRAQILPGALAAGSTEMVPIASMFQRLDKVTGGTFSKRALQFVKDKGVALFEGAAQEALQELMTNISAAEVYDFTKDITEGLEESATVGGATQLVLELIAGGVRGKRIGATPAELAEIRKAEELIRQRESKLAENLIKATADEGQGQGAAETQAEPSGVTEAQPEPAAEPVAEPSGVTEAQPEPAAEPVAEPTSELEGEQRDIASQQLVDGFSVFDSEATDNEERFDQWLQTLPENERELAVVQQEEIILTRNLMDLQAANMQRVADEGTVQEPVAQGNELPNNVLTEQDAAVGQTPVEEVQPQQTEQQPVDVVEQAGQEVQGVEQPTQSFEVRSDNIADFENEIRESGVDVGGKLKPLEKLGVKVVFHRTKESLQSALGTKKNVAGALLTPKDGQKVVHVNLSHKNAAHVFNHEVAHLALSEALGTKDKGRKAMKQMASTVRKSLQISAQDDARLEKFLSRYDDKVKDEEFLVEVAAMMASGKVKLNQSALEKVIEAVKAITKKVLGIDVQYDINNEADVRALFKALSGALSGKEGVELDKVIKAATQKAYPSVEQASDNVAEYIAESIKSNPNFKTAVEFIQQSEGLHSDQAIAKVVTKQLGFSPMEVTELFEAALDRKYRGIHPIQHQVNGKFEYLKLFGMFRKYKKAAYILDWRLRNAGTFMRNQVADIERRLKITLPANLNPYEAFNLWKPKAAYTEKHINESFFGGDTDASKRASFLGRLNSAGIKNAEFNEFMIAQHIVERYDRIVEIWEANVRRTLRKVDEKLYKAGNTGAKSFLPPQKRFPITQDLIDKANGLMDKSPAMARKLENEVQQMEAAIKKASEMADYQLEVYNKMGPKKLQVARQFFSEFQRDYLDKFVEVLEDGGMIDQKRANFLRNGISEDSDVVWENYVPMLIKDEVYADENGEFHDPLGRDFDSLAANVYNNGIHGITGNIDFEVADMKHPMDVAFHRLVSAVKAVEYNNAMRVLAQFTQEYGNPQNMRVIKSRTVPRVNEFGEVDGVDDFTPKIVKDKGHAFRTKGGKLAYIYFTDPNDMTRAMLRSNRYAPETMSKFFINFGRVTNNFYRGLLITFNTSFIVGNPFRDAQEAFANIRSEYNIRGMRTELSKRMLMSTAFFTGIGAVGNRIGVGDAAMQEMAMYWEEGQRMGMRMSWAMVHEPVTTEVLQKKIDEVEAAVAGGNKELAKNSVRAVRKTFESIADASENIVRLAAYSALRSKGVPPQKAAYIARNITVDFEKRGASKLLNSYVAPLYLFMNVGIQSAGRGMKLFTTPGGRKSLAVMAAIYGLNRVLLYMMSGMFLDKEEEEKFKRDYLQNDFIRRNYSLIFNPFDPANPVKLPKPYSPLRIVAGLTENLVDKAYGTRTIGDAVADLAQDMTVVIDPVSGGSGLNAPQSYLPFALTHPLMVEAPLFPWSLNKDWMGNPILRARDKGIAAYTFNKTTEARKFNLGPLEVPVGKAYVKAADGAYQWTRGIIDVSPTAMEYIVDSYILKNPPMKALGNIEDAITEYIEQGDELKLMHGVAGGLGAKKLYDPLSDNEKQELFNFFDIADRSRLRGMNDEHMAQVRRSVQIIKDKELADNRTINAWLETMSIKFPKYREQLEDLK